MPRTKNKKLSEQVRESAKKPVEPAREKIDKSRLVSTGSTLMNLALSDNAEGGFGLGKMVNLIGDSSSGKTFVALTTFAEAVRNRKLKDYHLIYDDVEAASEFDIEFLFGKKVVKRLSEPPNGTSNTIEEFQLNVHDLLDTKESFIYVLDSFDALTAEADDKKAKEQMDARRKGNQAKGDYGIAKPRKASELFRQIVRRLKQTDSLLIIVSQTRDDINPMTFTQKTRSGGKALKFYSTHEIWLAVGGQIKKHKIPVGIECLGKITKNKLTGKRRNFEFPIYYEYGIDDIGSCVDFLVDEDVLEKTKSSIDGFGIVAPREKFIKEIEEDELEESVREATAQIWSKIEEKVKLNRKRKYE